MSSYSLDDFTDENVVLKDASLTTGGIVSDFVSSQDNSKTTNIENGMNGGHVAAIIFLIIFLIVSIVLAVFMFIYRKKLYDMYKKYEAGINSKNSKNEGEKQTLNKMLEENKKNMIAQDEKLNESTKKQRDKLDKVKKSRTKPTKKD